MSTACTTQVNPILDGSSMNEQSAAHEREDHEHTDYARIAQAIQYLAEHHREQPTLDDLAAHLHLSPFHLQRLFTRWAGISPKRFLQYVTAGHAKNLLANAHSVLDTTYASGLSGPGRLHDLMVAVEAMSPGEFKRAGAGITISYGRHPSPFGDLLIAATERGICALSFIDDDVPDRNWQRSVAGLQNRWHAATLNEDAAHTAAHADLAAHIMRGEPTNRAQLLLKGTNFQLKVWEALLQIPVGTAWSYEEVAAAVGKPAAARAVGNAVAANPIGYLIPCHRVIRKSGLVEGYHWGATRKQAMLAWEAARQENERKVA